MRVFLSAMAVLGLFGVWHYGQPLAFLRFHGPLLQSFSLGLIFFVGYQSIYRIALAHATRQFEQSKALMRRQDAATLQQTEEHFRQFAEHLPYLVWMTTADKRQMLYINAAYETIFQRPRTYLFDMPRLWMETIHPDDRERVVAKNLDTEAPVSYVEEFRIVRPDGSLRWVRARTVPIRTPEGQLEMHVGIAEDITERKQAELDIQCVHSEQQAIFDAFPDLFFRLDSRGIFLDYKTGQQQQCYQPPSMVLGRTLEEALPEEIATCYRDCFENVLTTQTPRILEYSQVMHGTEVWFEARFQPFMQQEVLGIVRNLTERKHIEAALRQSETRLRELAAHIHEVFYLVDVHPFQMLYISPAYEKIWGRSCQQLYKDLKDFTVAIHPDDRQRVHDALECQQQGKSTESEYRIFRPDGEMRWILDRCFPVRDTTGNVYRLAGVAEDITAFKRSEETLQQERASLTQRVEERTAALSAANAELARATRLKDEFLASMSHELRTPLNSVLGFAEALQEEIYGPLTGQQQHSLDYILTSGRHLLELINDILDLSKIEAGKLDITIEPVAVETVSQSSLMFIKQQAHQKRLRLISPLQGDTITVLADARRLKQMLVNLLSNAVKFTPAEGTIGLEVALEPEHEVVRFTVWDTGIGIATDDLPRLFQPFIQLDSGLARQHSGTGLGLSLVRRFAELMEGSVAVESTVGQGSRFSFVLPWAKDAGAARPEQEADTEKIITKRLIDSRRDFLEKASLPGVGASTARALRPILLVEDNEANIATLENYLQSKGYWVIVARNGFEALERAQESHPALILMDIQMPGMDGIETTRHLRAQNDPVLATVPVIALTALAMPGDRERCLAAGANEYLTKPVSLKILVQTIQNYLGEAA